MDPLTAVAASGLRARVESLDLVANNLANASTGGYKADREFYSLYIAPEADAENSTMPLIDRPWTDLSQGVLHETGNALDVALSGRGFFAVNGPSGPLYTRNGNFRLSPAGTLTSAEGYAVRGAAGAPLTLQAEQPVEISSDGTILQNGVVAGKLEIVDFTAADGIMKQGSNYFPHRCGLARRSARRHCGRAGQAGGFQHRHRRSRRTAGQRHAPVRNCCRKPSASAPR